MKRLVFLGMMLLSVSGLTAPTQDDLRQLETQLQQERKAGELSARKVAELSGEVRNVQLQMVRLAQTIQSKEDELIRLNNHLKQMQERQAELGERLSLTNRQTVQIVSGLQTLALRPPELALIDIRTPIDALRSQMIMGYGLPVVQGSRDRVLTDLAELSHLKSDLQSQIVHIKSTQAQLSEQSAQMDRLLQQKSLLQAQYQVSQEQSQEKAKALAAQAKDLKDLLEKLALQKQQATQLAMQHAQGNRQSFRQLSEQKLPVINSFVRARGRLPYPIRGTITGHFGATTIGGGHTKGITLSGLAGAHVIAPFDGTVLFAGPFKNYGQLIILDHGDNYLTLLAGMEIINSTVGQQVLAGEPIGQLKTTKPNLYLEIRYEGQAVDPTPWFAKQN